MKNCFLISEPAVDFTSINEDEEISDSDSEADGVSRRGMQHTGEGHTNNSQSQGQSQNTGDEEVSLQITQMKYL